ncbi:hypothetical protein BEWA_005840 [Theileria equi strain WA]|uniref:Signal peptide-containing protein n=1 Tax=Theileria equi strain WA TaxID=1537102 RepID=L0B1P7_THEEQ|nr:hypothetical protein BEWA_005840 [Theileria equi strain WA]AFZ81176.1 hypothetical protein BEWA_005840 [Theileria equi strain WA]|eukprot:XP_004830842.1 hypothetical protein BEWA_005840 [Theileria equi strain WA]
MYATISIVAILTIRIVICINNNAGNTFSPLAMQGMYNFFHGMTPQESTPHIAVKIMPSKRFRISPSEMNSLLFTIKQEINHKVKELEEELYEHRYENERHLSTWALNKAPIYMPFHETTKLKTPKYPKTLNLAMKKLHKKLGEENKADDSKSKSHIADKAMEDKVESGKTNLIPHKAS